MVLNGRAARNVAKESQSSICRNVGTRMSVFSTHAYLQCPGIMPGFTRGWRLGPFSGLCLQEWNKSWPHYGTWDMKPVMNLQCKSQLGIQVQSDIGATWCKVSKRFKVRSCDQEWQRSFTNKKLRFKTSPKDFASRPKPATNIADRTDTRTQIQTDR